MKQLYVILIVFLIVSGMTTKSIAQKTTKEHVNTVLNEYQEQLGVTNEQCTELRPLMIKQETLIKSLAGLNSSDEKWIETNKEIWKLHEEIESLLTEKQKMDRNKIQNQQIINKVNGKSLYEILSEKELKTLKNEMDSISVNPTDSIQ